MSTVTLLEAKDRLPELVRAAEAGETVILTRDGEPVAEITPHRRRGVNYDALEAFKKKYGIEKIFPHIPEDFDDPLPEDILLRPFPPEK